MVVIALLALIIGVRKIRIRNIWYQILQLTKFKGELMSHHTLEDTFKIHRQLACTAQYGMFRTSNIATMSMDDVFLGDIYGLLLITCTVIIVTGQYYEQVLNGIKAEIRELKKKINSL